MATGTAVQNTLRYNASKCINCEMCIAVCPHGVFAPGQEAVYLVRYAACIECGACQRNCPTGAISVDAGVGCATAMIWAALSGSEEVTCGDSCCGGSLEDEGLSCYGGQLESPAEKGSGCCGNSRRPSCCG